MVQCSVKKLGRGRQILSQYLVAGRLRARFSASGRKYTCEDFEPKGSEASSRHKSDSVS